MSSEQGMDASVIEFLSTGKASVKKMRLPGFSGARAKWDFFGLMDLKNF